ncbi:hypothetical protein KHS38_20350 [Mucilaginibacter sp. Bleaf8]|uniref:hypothetical protein n=1 Tax=Mucilaginibacter sp. Bleaf8 TaxID=2834430 RepID=UPI001BCA9E1D|nr:hypothetical protein [Mucilaginibacter sp. Bleaf8]MBS7566768.1 hypothetical protein [Mucilaginibacter sp. Bleaf8]
MNILKKKSLFAVLILTGIATLYFSCKKNDAIIEKTEINKKDFALQIAKSLYESFAQDGNKASLAKKNASNRQATSASLCGTTRDSIVNSQKTLTGNISEIAKGYIQFTYLCLPNTTVPNSYHLKDSIHTIRESAVARQESTVREDYDAIGTASSFGVVSVTGKQLSHINYTTKSGTPKVIDQYNDFTLQNLQVIFGGIQLGRVPFTAKGTIDGTPFDFQGTVTFNYGVKIVVSISGEGYIVNSEDWTITEGE